LPYNHSIRPYCVIYLFLKKEAAELVTWGGVEFKHLVEIINPISPGLLEFQRP
jgi:hypothetical protein